MSTSNVSNPPDPSSAQQVDLSKIKDINFKQQINTVQGIFKNLASGIKFIFSRAKTVGTICQIIGAAAITLAAIAMVSAGALATLTGLGCPVGIPLIAIGVSLFTAGSVLTWKDISSNNPNAPFKTKIKAFFKRSAKNAAIGVATGAVAGTAAAHVALAAKVATGIGTAALFVGKNLGEVQKIVDGATATVDQLHPNEKLPIEDASRGMGIPPTQPEQAIGQAAAQLVPST